MVNVPCAWRCCRRAATLSRWSPLDFGRRPGFVRMRCARSPVALTGTSHGVDEDQRVLAFQVARDFLP